MEFEIILFYFLLWLYRLYLVAIAVAVDGLYIGNAAVVCIFYFVLRTDKYHKVFLQECTGNPSGPDRARVPASGPPCLAARCERIL